MADKLYGSEVYELAIMAGKWKKYGDRMYKGYVGGLAVLLKCPFFEDGKPSLVSITIMNSVGNSEVVLGGISRSRDSKHLEFYQRVNEKYQVVARDNEEEAMRDGFKKARNFLALLAH